VFNWIYCFGEFAGEMGSFFFWCIVVFVVMVGFGVILLVFAGMVEVCRCRVVIVV